MTAPRTALRIGLTGPIGCGKSTVAAWLGDAGAVVIDADAVARDVTAPGAPAVGAIRERFGDRVIRPDGALDRAALAGIVFADPSALRDLEAIVHPAVRPAIARGIEEAEAAGAAVVAIEAIKLVEGGLAELCDEVWLVACGEADQRRRLVARSGDEADADRRIAAQAGLEERVRPHAGRVLDTSGSLAEARAAVDAALAAALSRSACGRSSRGSAGSRSPHRPRSTAGRSGTSSRSTR